MGLFNYVKVPDVKCLKCKKTIKDSVAQWQSKEPEAMMNTVDYWETDEFHGGCPHCEAYLEFRISKQQRQKIPLSSYKPSIRKI